MKRDILLTAVAVALAGPPAAADAQMVGNPVYFSPKHGIGLSIQADYGRGLNDASGKTNYFGGRAVLGLPIVTVSAGGGLLDAVENDVTFGGNVSVNVLSAPLLPIAIGLQAGVGYLKQTGSGTTGGDLTTLNVPIGAAIAVKPPTPGLNVELWAAPRIQITRTSNGTSDTDTRFGASAGVNLGLPTGLGLHAAVDYTYVSAPAGLSSSDVSPILVGVGVHYKFTIPGLGIVGM